MKKAIYKDKYSEEKLVGFDSEYSWRSVSFFSGPDKAGRYNVICKDGRIRNMYYTGCNSDENHARVLFRTIVDSLYDTVQTFINEKTATDTDILNLYRFPWGHWYTVIDHFNDEDGAVQKITVHTKDSRYGPLYYLDLNLDGMIQLDKNGEIEGTDGVQYYTFNDENKLVKDDERKN